MSVLFDTAPPSSAVPTRKMLERLTFAFARGTEEQDLLGLVTAQLTGFLHVEESLGKDLFLDELVERAFHVVAEGVKYDVSKSFLRRLLMAPPSTVDEAKYRQRIFRELEEEPLAQRALESAYSRLRAFRTLLCQNERMGGRFGALHRRVEILVALKAAILEVEKAFSSSQSGLARASAWAYALIRSPAFESLTHVLAFEDSRTVIQGQLQVGFDGTLRRFDVVGVTEASSKAFARGPVSRFFSSLLGIFRGYRFSEEDVMSRLLDQTFSALEGDVHQLLRLSLELEFFVAGLGFRRYATKAGAEVCLPEFVPHGRKLEGLRNPWLLGGERKVVGTDFESEDLVTTVIVTGPNSGGKTRLLQSIAVTQLLAQQGLWVTAKSASLVWAPSFFLSLVERPASDQEEGRLGMELLRIRSVFERAGPNALVVMDELCSGTNPSEGEEIFEMVLELFAQVRPQVLISTHFLDFAARLAQRNSTDIQFIQVELGTQDIPTYRFVSGVAKTSMARATAARLGVTREELFELATRRAYPAQE